MISKKAFVILMKGLKDQHEKDHENGKLITKMGDPEFNNHTFIFSTPLINTVMTALQIEMKDKYDSGWSDISYWIYDLDFGRKWKPKMVTRKDGSDVVLNTAHKLYDWLVEQYDA